MVALPRVAILLSFVRAASGAFADSAGKDGKAIFASSGCKQTDKFRNERPMDAFTFSIGRDLHQAPKRAKGILKVGSKKGKQGITKHVRFEEKPKAFEQQPKGKVDVPEGASPNTGIRTLTYEEFKYFSKPVNARLDALLENIEATQRKLAQQEERFNDFYEKWQGSKDKPGVL
eukprot:CAMPEP_0198526856 /NCGR_PEP_ID=MMETSP1462-20131121/24203_1 /TAXON_ID=1333877 /ORGANISM="Brandtodinium nutriculum, Strain RCC3387" /LENGTH=173 /DNA_ID=CAMNT_0044256643 /DNA_START=69 /DNA_END=590 /DNA_ORIENTATION=-